MCKRLLAGAKVKQRTYKGKLQAAAGRCKHAVQRETAQSA